MNCDLWNDDKPTSSSQTHTVQRVGMAEAGGFVGRLVGERAGLFLAGTLTGLVGV
jgi:hypothetical protein